MSEAIWFVIKGPQEEGPYTPGQLDNMVRSGQLTDSQELRRKGDVKRYTVKQALAVKRQVQRNQMAEAAKVSTMSKIAQNTIFRAFLLLLLLFCVAVAALYFSGQYREAPYAAWLEAIGIDVEQIADPKETLKPK